MKIIAVASFFLAMIGGCRDLSQKDFEIDLDKQWRYNLDDSLIFSRYGYDDASWKITGTQPVDLKNHNDVIWYRHKVFLSSKLRTIPSVKKLEFYFGRIGDSDQLYFNGQLVGANNIMNDTGFVTQTISAEVARKYELPLNFSHIKWDKENLIAIRVKNQNSSDKSHPKGSIRLSSFNVTAFHNFNPIWKFVTGDSPHYSSKQLDDYGWQNIHLGQEWESQGFSTHDGYALYTSTFNLPGKSKSFLKSKYNRIRLFLGRIDDTDQVFLNGHIIGENGTEVPKNAKVDDIFKNHSTLAGLNRIYSLRLDDPRINLYEANRVTVRVFDSGGGGGMLGRPYLTVDSCSDELRVDIGKLYKINTLNKLDTSAVIFNDSMDTKFQGTLKYTVFYLNGLNYLEAEKQISIGPQDSLILPISIPYTKSQLVMDIKIFNSDWSNIFYDELKIPFVLKR